MHLGGWGAQESPSHMDESLGSGSRGKVIGGT